VRAGAASGLPASLVAQRLGRSTEQVRARRRALMAAPRPARPYLPHEDEAIRVCLAERGDRGALGRQLGRSPDAVQPVRNFRELPQPAKVLLSFRFRPSP
jgi:hypothetical protein